MGLKREFMKIANNKYALYGMMALAITNILGYLFTYKFNAVILFALITLITFQFTKNLFIVLLLGLFVTNFVVANNVTYNKEGMEINDTIEKKSKINPELTNAINALNTEGSVDGAKKILSNKKITNKMPVDIINVDIETPQPENNNPDEPLGTCQPTAIKNSKLTEHFHSSILEGSPIE